MRIIGGQLKRKRLQGPPPGSTTRPLPDHVRESIFNILRGHWEGASVLDVFSGTGSFGLEAVSRGATRVVLVEKDRRVARVLERNAEDLGVTESIEIVTGDALGPATISRCPSPCDILFFDPPYAMVRDPDQWPRVRLAFGRLIDRLAETGFAVLRTPWPFYHLPVTAGDDPDHHQPNDEDAEPDRVAPPRPEAAIDVDMTFENAEGPETHHYGSTALHLYMRSLPESAAETHPSD